LPAAAGAPHRRQNRASTGSGVPQLTQNIESVCTFVIMSASARVCYTDLGSGYV